MDRTPPPAQYRADCWPEASDRHHEGDDRHRPPDLPASPPRRPEGRFRWSGSQSDPPVLVARKSRRRLPEQIMLEPIGDGLCPAAESCRKNPPAAMPRRIVVVACECLGLRRPRRERLRAETRRAIKRTQRPPGGKPEADAGRAD